MYDAQGLSHATASCGSARRACVAEAAAQLAAAGEAAACCAVCCSGAALLRADVCAVAGTRGAVRLQVFAAEGVVDREQTAVLLSPLLRRRVRARQGSGVTGAQVSVLQKRAEKKCCGVCAIAICALWGSCCW